VLHIYIYDISRLRVNVCSIITARGHIFTRYLTVKCRCKKMNREVICLFIILFRQVRLVTVENPRRNESVSVRANGNKRLRYLAQSDI